MSTWGIKDFFVSKHSLMFKVPHTSTVKNSTAIHHLFTQSLQFDFLYLLYSARELELEDRQSRLQQELRERMAIEGTLFCFLQFSSRTGHVLLNCISHNQVLQLTKVKYSKK